MPIGSPIDLTQCRHFFEKPATPSQRQYEALRAYFVEGLASAAVARRFGFSPAAFRMLCYDFRRGQLPNFFTPRQPRPREQPKKSKVREHVVALRKRNYSIYDISRALKEQGMSLGTTAVREILIDEGFGARSRRGKFTVRLKTMRKRLRRSFNSVAQWCQAHRHDDASKQQATLNAKLRGHYRYYGRPTNYHSLWQFYRGVRCVWKKWLDRRSRGKTLTWEAYGQLLRRYPLLRPRITRPWAGAASRT
jgi:hypothetical protein